MKNRSLLGASLILSALALGCSAPKGNDASSDKVLDPNDALAYAVSGTDEMDRGDFDGAIADFNKAIELNSKIPAFYRCRGISKSIEGDFDGAIADFDKAIELEPNLARTYDSRGFVKRMKGDIDGAIADENKAIDMQPNLSGPYRNRGSDKNIAGDYVGAISDYEKYIAMATKEAEYGMGPADAADNVRLYLVLVLRRLHQDQTPAGLTPALVGGKQGWFKSLASYLTGNLAEPDFLAKITDGNPKAVRDRECQAFYYCSMTHLLAGDLPTAQDLFRKCVATRQNLLVEYDFARAEQHRLGDTTR